MMLITMVKDIKVHLNYRIQAVHQKITLMMNSSLNPLERNYKFLESKLGNTTNNFIRESLLNRNSS